MTSFSQPALLQALGWATLNSFWQVGLLWCSFVVLRRWIKPDARVQYRLAAGSLLLSLVAFGGSFLLYLQGLIPLAAPLTFTRTSGTHWFASILTAASLAYLLLLAVPTTRLVQNWRFLRKLRRSQLTKAPVAYRMYVQKIAWHLGIHKPVQVYLSALVQSPVTIGYLKPLVLLPVASFNQLSLQQAEAILLHELAHIRRFDFVVNIAINIIHTLLYFNPFVRMFVRVAESSRETCCDELVLQFGYDPMAYAGALVQLEKNTAPVAGLALAATGKNTLLTRIQTIVGIPSAAPGLKWRHFSGLLASIVLVLAIHSLLVNAPVARGRKLAESFTELANPFSMAFPGDDLRTVKAEETGRAAVAKAVRSRFAPELPPAPPPPALQPEAPGTPTFIQVAQVTDPMTTLEAAEQAQVAQTVAATQQVLATVQWQAMEQQMADALNEQEKVAAQRQYHQDLAAINWKQMEANLASRYHQTDWQAVNQYLTSAASKLQLDSLAAACSETLATADKLEQEEMALLLPDQPETAARQLRIQLRQLRDSLELIRKRPVVKL